MLKTAMVFGDNMVIQQQKKFKVWGTGTFGKSVTGTLKGKASVTAEAWIEENGKWMLTFPPQQVGRNLELIISDGEETIKFGNICIGEVWVAGGQSNMEYFLQHDAEKESVLNGAMNPDIRFFDYPKVSYEGQLEEHDYSRFGIWRTCTREDLPYFSAPAYYFAENLQNALDIPIGIVGCNYGGTPACAWMDSDYLKDNEGKAWLESFESAVKNLDVEEYKANFRANPMNDRSNPLQDDDKFMYPGLTRQEQLGIMRMMTAENLNTYMQKGPYSEKRPGGLYETMLKKVAPYTARGVIWYQGESDDENPELYGAVFSKMIECWRDLWEDKLPFLFVQLAPFGEWLGASGKQFPELRKQQEFVSKTVPDTWMISSSDAGMKWDIHPKYKKPIGTRLALLARGHIYGENILCDSPEFLNAERVNKGIRIYFKNAEGLHWKGDKLNALSVVLEDGTELTPLEVSVDQHGLLVKGDFPENVSVSFAKTGYYEVNLYNKEENPAKPFEFII
ncbi:sialate O-acetylesterase [Bacillus sp. USDA818B3_A]|uniref:sialate O-acetylesterase n=1 Tax=Bacillus sp. USDA818B3_A TaxID=2698834 RepID=UPI00136F0772|nr:sialate O-acetylesterase [Bacillus sp. USDA818B3_A]